MKKEAISSHEVPQPTGVYSQAVRANNLVFLAGQGPFARSGQLLAGPFEEQVRQTLRNLASVAHAAGGSLADAVRVGVYLRDMGNFPRMNDVFREFFSDPPPARTTIQSNLPGFEIEVDAILSLDD